MGRNNQNSEKAYGKDLASHLVSVAPAGFDSISTENENGALFQVANYETEAPLPEPDPVFDAGTDSVIEEETVNTDNYDVITSGNSNDTIVVETSNDTLVEGLDGNDYLLGEDGNDILYGGAGDDYLWGGVGDDTLHGGTENDTLIGADGKDTLCGDEGNDILKGNLGNDILEGCDGDDALYGGADNDALYGGAGNDLLDGGLGNDILHGGAGSDTLIGRGGADTFYFIATDGMDTVDTIVDFNADMDAINISDLLSEYDPLTDAIEDFVQITDDGVNSTLAVDIDGGADNFVEIATINNVTDITNEQFLADSGILIIA